MKFEPQGLLGLLKSVLPLFGLWLFFYLMKTDFEEIAYQIEQTDWLYVALWTGAILILIGVPAYRLYLEYRIWTVLRSPFHIIRDPFLDVDMNEDSYGAVVLQNGRVIKHAAINATATGVIVRKAAYPKLFPTFEIRWDQISNIYFAALTPNEKFGSDPFGAARVTLSFAEEFVLVLPWRKGFNADIPDRIGVQYESLVE